MSARVARRQAAPATARSEFVPAPMAGLNTVSAPAMGDAVVLWNMTAAEYGQRVRLGWREWVTGLTGGDGNQVRTVLPYRGSAEAGTGDRLFATTTTGIWDCTASSATPTQVLTFASDAGSAGRGVAHVMVTAAGHFLLYCDEQNGYHVYTESTDTWAKIAQGAGGTQVSGVDPATFCSVLVWKSRVWFVEKNSTRAWYLAAGTVYGAATQLNLDRAGQFRGGGALRGLWNWTGDGGFGLDDHLVAISGGGDVAIYAGTDPAEATTFQLKGSWQTGGIPAGRNIATASGGDLLLVTKAGVRPLSSLVSGGDGVGEYATARIRNLFNSLMLSKSDLNGWSLHVHPEDASLIVTVPEAEGVATQQLVMAMAAKSWSRYRDLPIFSAASWGGKLYFGTSDGRVCINDGYVDGVTLADSSAYTPVQWTLLTAFVGDGRQKQVGVIRPHLITQTSGTPAFSCEARYDFNLVELDSVSGATSGSGDWDTGVWDTAVWGGDYSEAHEARGATGLGTSVAIVARGTATSRTVLRGFDVTYEEGGFL